jgi:hypothetical protein
MLIISKHIRSEIVLSVAGKEKIQTTIEGWKSAGVDEARKSGNLELVVRAPGKYQDGTQATM